MLAARVQQKNGHHMGRRRDGRYSVDVLAGRERGIVMRIEIETRDRRVRDEFFNRSVVAEATAIVLGSGVTLKGDFLVLRKADNFPYLASIIVGIVAGTPAAVAANLITSWLLNPERRIEKVTIDNMEIELDESQIKRIVIEKITKERSV
jgi:hypothetical protein